MPLFPIYSLQDVDPRSNESSVTTDLTIMAQANEMRKAKREYYANANRRMASGLSVVGGY